MMKIYTSAPNPAAQEHFHLERGHAEKYMTKARQYLCKEAQLSIYLRHADQETLEYRWGMKNDGCRNPRMHGSSRCTTCSLSHRANL